MLIHTPRASDRQIVTIAPSTVLLSRNTTEAIVTFTITTETVPAAVPIHFELKSLFSHMHRIDEPVKVLSFSQSHRSLLPPPPLHVKFSSRDAADTQDETTHVGRPVRSRSTPLDDSSRAGGFRENLSPVIHTHSVLDVSTNNVTFEAYVNKKSLLYAMVCLQGSPAPTPLELTRNQSYAPYAQHALLETQIRYGSAIDHLVRSNFSNLEAQTNYVLYLLAESPLGCSGVSALPFKTKKLSYGILVTIPLKSVATAAQITSGLAKTLRIPEERFLCLTDSRDLIDYRNNFNAELQILPDLYFQVVIQPNATCDHPHPSYYGELLL